MEEHLLVCCTDACLELERAKILNGHPPGVQPRSRFTVNTPASTVQLITPQQITTSACTMIYHHISTCAHVVLTRHQIELLNRSARLLGRPCQIFPARPA